MSAYADRKVVLMEQIPDAVFSQGIMGVCCGIDPENGNVYAPADGTVSQVTDTLHAIGLNVGEKELLLHAGVDTVEMNGEGFTGRFPDEGAEVRAFLKPVIPPVRREPDGGSVFLISWQNRHRMNGRKTLPRRCPPFAKLPLFM